MASNKFSTAVFMIGIAGYVLLSHVSFAKDDEVQVKDCGWTNFTASYSPSKIKPGDTLHVSAKFKTPMLISEIKYTATLFLTDGKIQILSVTDKLTCKDIPPRFRSSCPVQKGIPFQLRGYAIKTPTDLPLAADNYTVDLKTWNQDNEKLVCAEATFEILDN